MAAGRHFQPHGRDQAFISRQDQMSAAQCGEERWRKHLGGMMTGYGTKRNFSGTASWEHYSGRVAGLTTGLRSDLDLSDRRRLTDGLFRTYLFVKSREALPRTVHPRGERLGSLLAGIPCFVLTSRSFVRGGSGRRWRSVEPDRSAQKTVPTAFAHVHRDDAGRVCGNRHGWSSTSFSW